MARYLILDHDGSGFVLAAATAGRGGLKVDALRGWADEQPLSLPTAERLGRELREKLAAFKMPAAPLVVVLGRDRLVLKEIKHPAVPSHDEPAVIRFQAMKELTDAGDDVVIDYQPRGGTGTERKALAIAVRRDVLKAAQLLAQNAGLKLAGLVPRAFGLIAAARSAVPSPDPGEAFAVLSLSARGGEFIVARAEQLLFARPVAAPALASETSLLGEVRRNLAVYSGQSPQAPVRGLYVAEGGTPPGVTDKFRDTLAVPVHGLFAAGVADLPPGAAAGVLGTARALAAGPAAINFVKPREPRAAADPHRRPILLAAALAAVIVLALGLTAWTQVSAKDRRVSQLRAELNTLTADLAALDPDAKRWDEVKKWLDGEVIWLDELYDLTARVPDVSKMRVVQLAGDPLALPMTNDPRKKPYVAKLTVEGIANEESKAFALFSREWVKDGGYKVESPVIKPNSLSAGFDRRQFAQQFTAKFELEKRPPGSFTRQFTATAPPRKPPGGEGFNMMNLFPGGRP